MRRPEAGLSLIEGLVVVALLVVLAMVAVPRLAVPEPLQVRVQARELAADLRLAQRLAIARRANYVLEFAPAAPPYAQYAVRAEGGAPEPDFPKTLAPEVSVAGTLQFVFHPDGGAAAGGTITVTSGATAADIQVNAATGRVTVNGP